MKIKKHEIQALRNVLYGAISTLGNVAEESETTDFDEMYSKGCEILDMIDNYCTEKNLLEPETILRKDK